LPGRPRTASRTSRASSRSRRRLPSRPPRWRRSRASGTPDYTRDDFTATGKRYDLIFDNVENRSLGAVRRALTERGTLVLNSGTGAQGLAMLVRLVRPVVMSPFVGHSLRRFLSTPKVADLEELVDLIEAGRLRPVVDRTYSLAETPVALRHIASGRSRGKVVIAIAPAS
jgi:NADPH:quinone reductase-like Zn-dependent oxidoreductase